MIVSRGVTLNIETRLLLTDNYIDIYDEAYDQEGTPVWQRKDGKGSHMKRARIFDCWSVLRKSEDKKMAGKSVEPIESTTKAEDSISHTNRILRYKSFSTCLLGEKTRDILKLGLHKAGESGTFIHLDSARHQ